MRLSSKIGLMASAFMGMLALSSGAMAAHHHGGHHHCHPCPGGHSTHRDLSQVYDVSQDNAVVMTTYTLKNVKLSKTQLSQLTDTVAQNASSTISPMVPGQSATLLSGVVFNKQAIDIISVIHNTYKRHGQIDTMEPKVVPGTLYASDDGPAIGLAYGVMEFQKVDIKQGLSETMSVGGTIQTGIVMARDHSSILKVLPAGKKGRYNIYVVGLDTLPAPTAH